MHTDTICSVITAPGTAAVSIIRISGSNAYSICDKVFKGKKTIKNMESHTIQYGHILDKDAIIDEVILLKMNAPKSYTCENTIEIQCHGGNVSTSKILELLIINGARVAEPGEFTKRAFLNGRIDLTEAEAVMDIISATSELALKNSVKQLKGTLKHKIFTLTDKLVLLLSSIEAWLEFPDDDVAVVDSLYLSTELKDILSQLQELLQNSKNGEILKNGIKTAIIGRPNVGKSSILNYILETDRAIVSEISGTTRDIIKETVLLKGVPLILIDTAGIRKTACDIENKGIVKSHKELQSADLVLLCLDRSNPLTHDDIEIMENAKGKELIVLLNKADKQEVLSNHDVIDILGNVPIFLVSAKTGIGFDMVYSHINGLYTKTLSLNQSDFTITNPRHIECLNNALIACSHALNDIESNIPADIISIAITDIYTNLAEIVGIVVDENVINKIFETFCVGK